MNEITGDANWVGTEINLSQNLWLTYDRVVDTLESYVGNQAPATKRCVKSETFPVWTTLKICTGQSLKEGLLFF